MEKIDLKKAVDNFCQICGKKKEKYIDMLLGTEAVFYRTTCGCDNPIKVNKTLKSNKKLFDELQTPFWKIVGLKPKENDVKLEKWLKWKGMSYGDYRRMRDSRAAKYPSAVGNFNQHINKYGRSDAPNPNFEKEN